MKMLPEALRTSIESESTGAEGYEAVRSELEALSEAELLPVNLLVPAVISRVLGALPHLARFRNQLARLPDFDRARFDRLELYARALSFAHARYQVSAKPPNSLRALREDARGLRTLLLKDVELAVARGWVPRDTMRNLRGHDGYRNTAHDLEILSGVLEKYWEKLEGKCGTSAAELEYASRLSFHLLRSYGFRRQSEDAKAGTRAERARPRLHTPRASL